MAKHTSAQLTVRNATMRDIKAIQKLVLRAYPHMGTYPLSVLRGQITAFPDGQFVVEYEDEIVG